MSAEEDLLRAIFGAPCICGCPMHGGTCRCGCSYYEPTDANDEETSL